MDKEKLEQLQNSLKSKLFNTFGNTIEEFEANAEKLPFIGTITDFNIIKGLYNNSNIVYNERELLHLNEILNISREKEQAQIDKMTFSLKCIKQLSDFKNNQRFRGNELLQATYMSIFSRYNDNRDRSNNIFVSRDLIDEVIREEHESEIGKIYITYKRYDNFLYQYIHDTSENKSQKDSKHNKRFVSYVLRNIRNNIAHGDFCNLSDNEKQIVNVESQGENIEEFKAKFEFQCLNSICNKLAQQLKNSNEDVLFELEDALKNGTPDKLYYSCKDDENKIMSIVFPIYINSFIVYNFKKFKDLKKVSQFGKGKESEIVRQFYDRNNSDSFLSKIVQNSNNESIDEFEVFRDIRNSVVHNKVVYRNGCIITENGLQIPYAIFYDMLHNQEQILSARNENKEEDRNIY